ncbi:MAG: hypothetical protein ACOYN4_20505 [Bacteroidales bacterium]
MLKWIPKSGMFLQVTLFVVILFALWIPAFVNPLLPVSSAGDGPLYKLLSGFFQYFPGLGVTLALLLVVIQSVALFYVFESNGFFGRRNFMPAIIALIALSWDIHYQTLHALLPAGIFVLIALNSIMSAYGKQSAYHQVFTASFSIAMASLFYIPLAYLLLMVWFTLITYRVSSWREYAVSLIGFILPFIYYLSWLFWDDNFLDGVKQIPGSLFKITYLPNLNPEYTIWLSISIFIMLVTMFAVLNIMNDKLISLRRRSWVLFNFSFTSMLIVVLSGWQILTANYLFIIPLVFFISGSLVILKRPFWFEILAITYFVLFLALRLYMFF